MKSIPKEVYVILVNGIPFKNYNRKSSCLYFRLGDAEKQAEVLRKSWRQKSVKKPTEVEVETYPLVKKGV